MRGEIKTILKKIQCSKSNIIREERMALEELRKDKSKMILIMKLNYVLYL